MLLIGYAVFNKGFAYVGVAPIFISEVFLAFSFFLVLAGSYSSRVFGSPLMWIVILFITWGAVRTFPYVQEYGLNALRDAVVWGYAFYAVFIAGALLQGRLVGQVPRWFSTWFPWFLVIAPILYMLGQLVGDRLPKWPGTDTSFIHMKPGDMAVHLAGIAGFLGLGLHRRFLKPGERHLAGERVQPLDDLGHRGDRRGGRGIAAACYRSSWPAVSSCCSSRWAG